MIQRPLVMYLTTILCLSLSMGEKLHAENEIYESEAITRGKADLFQALRKRSVRQMDTIDLTLEELAQAINANTIKVSDKKVFADHIIKLRTFLDKLKKEKLVALNEKNMGLVAEINKALIGHIHNMLDKGFKSFKYFDAVPVREEFRLLREETITEWSSLLDESNFSRILIILGENDQALKSLVIKNRLAGSSAFNRFFKKSEREVKQKGFPTFVFRFVPYALLGLYNIYLTHADELPTGFKWLKPIVGDLPTIKTAKDRVIPGVEDIATPVHGLVSTPMFYVRNLVGFDPKSALNLGIMLYFASRVKEDISDLYKWTGEKAKMALTKLKGESYEDPSPVKASKISFSDIAGYDHAKGHLATIVNYFKSKELFDRMGTHVDRGYLMVGPLDIGKQLTHGLADAITKEMKVNDNDAKCGIYEVHSSALVKKDIALMIKEIEKESPVYPCIILIDDLEWLIDHAKSKPIIWGDLVSAMNSNLRGNKKQVFIFATARDTSKVYSTIKGQSRLGSLIQFGSATLEERKEFFVKELTKRGARVEDFNVELLALHTKGCSYDLLTVIVRKAFGMAHAKKEVTAQRHIEQAIDSIVHGIMQYEHLDAHQQEILAAHYAGRALVQCIKEPNLSFKVTTLPTGLQQNHGLSHGGLIVHTNDHYATFVTNQDLENKMVVALAGSLAEKILNNGDVSHSLAEITKQTALSYAKQIVFEGIPEKELSKNVTNQKLEQAWKKVEDGTEQAAQLLSDNLPALERIAQELKLKHVLTREEVQTLIK